MRDPARRLENTKNLIHLLIALVSLLALAHCSSMEKDGPLIEESRLLNQLPSGSGLAIWKDSLFVISDDAPFIYRLALSDFSYQQFPLKGYTDADYRIPKSVKPDFEGAAIGRINGADYLLAFGSGSKSPRRDSLLIIRIANIEDQKTYSLSEFYKGLHNRTNTRSEQWNLEGVAIVDDTLLLFNRGNNMVVELRLTEFISYILNGGDFPDLLNYTLNLPSHEGHLARISGACELNDNGDILFCASIEDTPNWYTDGPVVGSYVGIFNRRTKALLRADLLVDKDGKALKEKVESIELINAGSRDNIKVIVIADNDKGQSRLMKIIL